MRLCRGENPSPVKQHMYFLDHETALLLPSLTSAYSLWMAAFRWLAVPAKMLCTALGRSLRTSTSPEPFFLPFWPPSTG